MLKSNLKIYLFTLIPFICFIIGYGLSNILIGNKSYTTPNLIGLTMHEAICQTSPFHINIQLAAEKQCPGIAHGTIMSQKPAPGRLIKSHQSIVVVTSKLPDATLAPNLIGLSKSNCQSRCEQQRIKLKSYPLEYQLPAGTCIGQTPCAGQPLPDKKLVIYCAQDNAKTFLMPVFIGIPLHQVINFLQKHDIQINVFKNNQKLSPPYHDAATIISQKPSPGSFVNLQKNMIVQLEV